MPKTPPDNPAGPYVADSKPSPERLDVLITEIENFPIKLRNLVGRLSLDQLELKYKNWTIRQIIHHLADSHVNAYIRTKLTLTEDRPTIKPYDETKWSQLPDAVTMDVEASLRLLEGVHARWAAVLRAMKPADFERTYFHPEHGKEFRLSELVDQYAWHARHHSEMIVWLIE